MKKLILFSLLTFVITCTYAGTSGYYVDDAAVEETLSSAIQIDLVSPDVSDQMQLMNMTSVQAADPDPWVSFALAFVLGSFGIHRLYLGGKGSLVAIYIVTCGGIFGVVPLIDWIVLLIGAINDDISKFVNNDAFFMWK